MRQHPEIALEFARTAAGITLPAGVAVSLVPTDMSSVVPVQYLAELCPDPAEAAKCRQLIRTGHPGFDLAPIAEGEARGKAEAILRLLEARHLNASHEQRAQVMSCTDAARLDLWFDRAITVHTAAEVFAD